ncbi:MAG: putative metal-dependent hydrolase [Rubricoccaceae bacterium]|nr:putative metal-dependent hydrolase [Rubricoccaceae bacterium]
MTDLRYPIGKFDRESEITADDIALWIDQIEMLPRQLRNAVEDLNDEQLETPYRPGGWSVRQVVHHIGDSHLNSLVRFKWGLTEEEPTIKIYHEERWAELADYREVPIETALDFLEVLHVRLVALLRSLSNEDLARRFIHPETGPITLARNIGLYAWHGRHHLAHITRLKEREGWD